jgi:DNA-directed RNA polymerase beta subunit
MKRTSAGYILVEAVIAMTILSIGVMTIQRGIRQTLIVRGQARDYTQARFLLENIIAEVELQPEHAIENKSGQFGGDQSRFRWSWEITKIDLPAPPLPPNMDPKQAKELNVKYLAKIKATVRWTRNNKEYEETMETLFAPEKLWLPGQGPAGAPPPFSIVNP